MNEALPLGEYQHYKGGQYEVIGIAKHSETLEPLVIYCALNDLEETGRDVLWARPLSIFLEEVEVGDKKIPRFKRVEGDA